MVNPPCWKKTKWIWPLALALLLPMHGLARSAQAAPEVLQLAFTEADSGIPLEEIVSGRARLGFSPVIQSGRSFTGTPGRSVWLRVRLDLPADGAVRLLSLPRQPIDSLRLYQAGPPELVLAETGASKIILGNRWPDVFALPLPTGASGRTTFYLQVQGHGYLNLQPVLLTEQQLQAQAAASSRIYDFLYGGLLLIVLLAVIRGALTGERTLRVTAAAAACLVASIVGNFHLQLTLGGVSLASVPVLPTALWVLACAPLLWATQQYGDHEKYFPVLALVIDRMGFAVLALGLLIFMLPRHFLPEIELAGLVILMATALVCAASLVYDPRPWRWAPSLLWVGVLLALLAVPMSMLQLMPDSILVNRGFQLLLTVQLAIYLLLPWARQVLHQRVVRKRSDVPGPTVVEKIAHAREWMISSLQAGIENSADDGDMEWIAYRRLLGGLKPVLPQSAAAVIAMNYHNEDLLLVEPKAAEARFQALLAQRGSLLKNLSRSLAPQQIGVDFDQPEGQEQVFLAVIPLPIERPGWGVLVIERSTKASYSDDELDLCTEFAALATTAGDEAAKAMQARQANEIDGESGVYKREMIDVLLRRAHELSVQRRKPLSMLRIGLDDFERFAAGSTTALIHRVVDLLRDEIDYGETIARIDDGEFVVFLSGRSIGEARTLGERLCVAVRKQAVPTTLDGTLQVSLGIAQMQPGERVPQNMLDRSAKALAKARQHGGNQVQVIVGAV